MSSWIISGNVFDNSFQILSGIGGEIIDITGSPLSLRKLGIHTIKNMIMKSDCQSCAILSLEMQIPAEVHDDVMKALPGEFLVRCQ